jgi:hypothetical protein
MHINTLIYPLRFTVGNAYFSLVNSPFPHLLTFSPP